jgi:hypothetical protein
MECDHCVKGKDTLKVGTSNMAHYGMAQLQIREGALAVHETRCASHLHRWGCAGERVRRTPQCWARWIVGDALTGTASPVGGLHLPVCHGGREVSSPPLAPHTDPQLGPRTVVLSNPRLPKAGDGGRRCPLQLNQPHLSKRFVSWLPVKRQLPKNYGPAYSSPSEGVQPYDIRSNRTQRTRPHPVG